MPSVRAYMVLSALAELGETLACVPTPDDVDTFNGRDDRRVGGLRARPTPSSPHAAGSVADVADVDVFEAVADAAVETGRGAAERRRRSPRPRRPPPRRGAAAAAHAQGPPRPCASTPSGSTS